MQSKSRAAYELRLHIVLVTKYRRQCLTPEILTEAKRTFAEILQHWNCVLIEFGADADHVHLLVDIHPALDISVLVNNLKSASSRRLRARFAEHLSQFYWKPVLWHRAYYVGSVGAVSLATIQQYVARQGIDGKENRLP